jgi:hypothetical protein
MLTQKRDSGRKFGANFSGKMKPQLTLNTRGFEFTLQEPRDNTLRAGLRDKGLHRVGLEVFSKINKDNPGKEASINAKRVRGLEVISWHA